MATLKSDMYKKHTHREHILELPDTYIGSTDTTEETRWIYDPTTSKMDWKKIQYNPGLYKIFDEILVNARDEFVRSQTQGQLYPVSHIGVNVSNLDDGSTVISIENDGRGIPIAKHSAENVLVPELIFGHLLTSSNYNKEEEKIVGGKNGYGAKLTNIFSTEFTVDIRTPTDKQYTQTWKNNMSICEPPIVKKTSSQKGHVKITFKPDSARFKGVFDATGLSNEMIHVFHTRTVEIAAMAGSSICVSWNGSPILVNSFERYIRLFIRNDMFTVAYEKCGPRWEIGAILISQLFSDTDNLPEERHISFVNGIMTRKGGKHVDCIIRKVLADFCDVATKKKVDIKPGQIKDTIIFFVNATIVNPSFDSQTKDYLTTPGTKFGSTPVYDGILVDGLVKLGLLDEAKAIMDAKAMRDAKKTDGKKKTTLRGIPKLEDALWAGTPSSKECTLILTEGDSAATSAISGLSIVGRERWGVFPLRGKLLNVKDITTQKFNANEELTSLKRIIGLEHGRIYTSIDQLRYGRIMIMADQDHDGSHIKGLIMNLFHTEWASLLKIGFLCTLKTPLLKAFRTNSGSTPPLSFYSEIEYDAWKSTQSSDLRGWKIKYYKGLGTSTPAEAREWFQQLHEIKYEWDMDTDAALNLAFNKKQADDRKRWLYSYDSKRAHEEAGGKTPYSRFVHNELIHFSNADNIRSLPHLMDGLKPSQRKILYCCLKRNLTSEIRVAQLAGYVSEHAAYHHGEASLNSTIIGMAQNFVGANNLNLLKPIGQFGGRLMGGKDSASPRYIHTHLEHIISSLFRKEDIPIMTYNIDDGEKIEPAFYLPTVPLLAINGSVGIGTGFSTNIIPYNPADIITLIQHRLQGTIGTLAGRHLDPWWFGFTGKVVRQDESTWITKGLYTMNEAVHTITITELPVGYWTKDYKIFLDELLTTEGSNTFGLKSFDDLYTDTQIKFVLYFTEEGYDNAEHSPSEFEKNFKLTTSWKTTNMHCFNTSQTIVKYSTIGDIMEAFIEQRLPYYELRRQYCMKTLKSEITELSAKMTFLSAIMDGQLVLMKKTDAEIVDSLKICGIPPLSDVEKADNIDAYDYVLRLRIDRVKSSAVDDLQKQIDTKLEEVIQFDTSTPSGMWLCDLEDFKKALTQYTSERTAEIQQGSTQVLKKKKTATKRINIKK